MGLSESDWLLLTLSGLLLLYVADHEGLIKMAAADFQKLVDNMKRAKAITDRAAADASKHASIMDNFEKRLGLNDENMTKIEEYEKLMASMDQVGNGGPALETTFQSSGASTPPPVPGNPLIHDPTGKQL